MSTTTVADQVERVLKPIQQFSRGWMASAATEARAAELGLASGEAFWIVGRAGVLGSCDAAVAAAGLAFLAPDYVRATWDHLPPGTTHSALAAEYIELGQRWGTLELARFDRDRLERLDQIGRTIVNAAEGSMGTVFAGTRALPQPDEVGARVSHTIHVLRELRGAAHIMSVHVCGLTPLQAILVSPAVPPRTGPAWATHLGWSGPFVEATDDMREARLEAERMTSRLLCPIYASVGDDDLEVFAELIEATRNSIEM